MSKCLYVSNEWPFPITHGGRISDAAYVWSFSKMFDEILHVSVYNSRGKSDNDDSPPNSISGTINDDFEFLNDVDVKGGGYSMTGMKFYHRTLKSDKLRKILDEYKPDHVVTYFELSDDDFNKSNCTYISCDYFPETYKEELGNYNLQGSQLENYIKAKKIYDDRISAYKYAISPSRLDVQCSGDILKFVPHTIRIHEYKNYIRDNPTMLFSGCGGPFRGKRAREITTKLFFDLSLDNLSLYIYSTTVSAFLKENNLENDPRVLNIPFKRSGYLYENVTFSFMPTDYLTGIPSKVFEASSKGIPCLIPRLTKSAHFNDNDSVLSFTDVNEIPDLINDLTKLRKDTEIAHNWIKSWNSQSIQTLKSMGF